MISDLTNIKGIEDLLTLISENGINNLSPAIEVLLNESMKIEREQQFPLSPILLIQKKLQWSHSQTLALK